MEQNNFSAKLAEHSCSLRAFASRFTRDQANADDLYQETLLKAFRYYGKFTQDTNFKAWLFKIMKNTFINDFRKEKRREKVLVNQEDFSSSDLYSSSAKNLAEGSFVIKDVNSMLAKLPENLYRPFVLYFEGHPYQEISEMLDIPLGTVKTRIYHAREALKKHLRPYA